MKWGNVTKRPARTNTALSLRQLAGIFFETFLSKNIVLVQAISLCPIIGAGVNLQYGVVLSLCTAAVLLPTSLFMSFFGEKIPSWLRPPVYTVAASALLIGAALIVDKCISHEIYAYLYLYLPLMAVNTIFTYRAGGFSVSNRPVAAVTDALGSSFGFALVICVVSALREMAAYGTLWNVPLGFSFRLPEAAAPFIGFLLLGFMAAFLQWLKSALAHLAARHQKEGDNL